MEPEGSLPHSQASATCLSLASPIQSIYPHPTSWRSILILSTHLHQGLPSGLLPPGFSSKTLYTHLSSPIFASCPAHRILLDFITRTILGEHYRSFSPVQFQKPSVRLHVTKTGHQAKMSPLYDSVQSLNVILESVARVVPELVARVRLSVHSLEHKNFFLHIGFVIIVTMCNSFFHWLRTRFLQLCSV